MKENFFERHKKKSLLALLFLGGRGKYVAFLLLAAVVSVPFIITEEGFKAFTQKPAIAAALRALGFTSNAFSDKDFIANANSAGKKSSYWKKYFRLVNAPLPSSKFSSLGYLDGKISNLSPAKITDETKNKYGINGVANGENPKESNYQTNVDLSTLVSSVNQTSPSETPMIDSMSRSLELGSKSMYAPYMSKRIVVSRGGAENKEDALANKVHGDMASIAAKPSAPRTSGSNGRVSGFSWNRMGRGKRANAFNGHGKGGVGAMSSMLEAYSYAQLYSEDDITPEVADTLASATFDGNGVTGDTLDTSVETGVPVNVPSGSFISYFNTAVDAMQSVNDCMDAFNAANESIRPYGEENEKILDSMDLTNPPVCKLFTRKKVRRWNNKVRKIMSNCNIMQRELNNASEKCKNVQEASDLQCSQYNDWIIPCNFGQALVGSILAFLAIALAIGLVIPAVVMIFSSKARDWFRNQINGLIKKLNGQGDITPPENSNNSGSGSGSGYQGDAGKGKGK